MTRSRSSCCLVFNLKFRDFREKKEVDVDCNADPDPNPAFWDSVFAATMFWRRRIQNDQN